MNKCHPEFSKWLKSLKCMGNMNKNYTSETQLPRHSFDMWTPFIEAPIFSPSFLAPTVVSHTHWTVKIWRLKLEALQFAAFGEARKVSVQSPSTFAPGKKGPEASKTDCAAKITPISLDCMVGVSKETVTFPSRGAAPIGAETMTFSFWTQQPAKNSLIGRTTVVFTSAGKSTVVPLFPLILPPSCWQTGMVVVVLLVVVLVVQVVVLVVLLGWYGR